MPLEAVWGLGSPLAGRDPGLIAELLERTLVDKIAGPNPWHLLLCCGLEAGSTIERLVRLKLARFGSLEFHEETTRHVASLAGGLDGFLGRRSRNFRRSLLRADREARALGIEFEVESPTRHLKPARRCNGPKPLKAAVGKG